MNEAYADHVRRHAGGIVLLRRVKVRAVPQCRMRLASFVAGATLLLASPPALAQGFFESLFGLGSPPPQARSPVMTPGGRPYAFPSTPVSPRRDEDDAPRDGGPRYRTVCVRLCDGYHFPVSASIGRRGFFRDQMRCRNTCGEEAKLFFMPAAGTDIAEAVDLNGRGYMSYRTANLYKKTLVAGCQCRADPWSPSEMARHQQYAEAEEAERARAHAAAIQTVVADAGGAAQPAPPSAEPAAVDVAPKPIPAIRPPKLVLKPAPLPKPINRGPMPVRVTATPGQSAGSFNTGMGLGGGGLVWPGDAPKPR